MDLTEREKRILQTVVQEYVTSGRPAGSALVLEKAGLQVSPATVRNELALLEQHGLVIQLHTSGGRIPTTAGYRYYIERLLPAQTVPDDDQITIRHQFHQAHTELQEWLKLAAAVLAHRAHTVALVTPPRVDEVQFKHVELIEAQPHTVLIIVVLSDGSVLQEMMATDEALSQEVLRSYADQLNQRLGSAGSYARVKRSCSRLPDHMMPYSDAVLRLMGRARNRGVQVYHEGLSEMLAHDSFSASPQGPASGERIRRVLDFLQQGLAMEDLLSVMAMEAGVHVVIGGETPLDNLHEYSMVVGGYGSESEGRGVLGLLGPTRMDYGRAISLVRYMTELMTDVVFGSRFVSEESS